MRPVTWLVKPALVLIGAAAAGFVIVSGPPARLSDRGTPLNRPAPEFPARDAAAWIGSPPLTLAALKGQVVLLDVWTFG